MKSPLRLLAWLAGAGIVLLALIEGGLWLAAPIAKRASHRISFDNQIPGLKQEVSYVVDGRYLRHWQPSEGAATGGRPLKILVLGGGATAALLQDDADAWWGQLGAELQKEFPQARVEVSALFREAAGALYGAKWAQENLPALKPDIVIAAYGTDDIYLHNGDYTYNAQKLATLDTQNATGGGLKNFVLNVSQIARRISNGRQKRSFSAKLGPLGERNAFAKLLARQRGMHAQLPLKYEVERPEGRDPAAEYLDALQSIAATAKASGAAFCVLGEPTLHRGLMGPAEERLVHRWFFAEPGKGDAGVARLDSGWVELELGRYLSQAEKWCESGQIPFLDPLRKMPPSAEVFVDDVMLTDTGATLYARLALPLVKPLAQAKLQ